ncbi:hypothetical protein [Tropicimonas isoalkanivorans]|uniref:hypothetical protein n=1 Tax=Tropicimonas isoalkanivorans TaxID=441112 RepID=UPI0015A5C4DE|nr:hypothetical protein [Tropicimonas isoalkanivorans]
MTLIFFSLRHQAAYGLWKSGADMFGGTERRHRVVAHLRLRDMTAEMLRGRG